MTGFDEDIRGHGKRQPIPWPPRRVCLQTVAIHAWAVLSRRVSAYGPPFAAVGPGTPHWVASVVVTRRVVTMDSSRVVGTAGSKGSRGMPLGSVRSHGDLRVLEACIDPHNVSLTTGPVRGRGVSGR